MLRRRRNGSTASITYSRIEPVGFVPAEVEYQIDGQVSPYFPATRDEPADGGEAEVTQVTRIHPITGKAKTLPESDWPFSSAEMDQIEYRLAEAPQQDLNDAYFDEDVFRDR
jgi:hypothetical protein